MIVHTVNKETEFSVSPQIISRFFLYFAGLFFLLLSFWLGRTFGQPTFEQILYHLKFGADGLQQTDSIFIYSFVKWCFFLPLGISILAVIVEVSVRKTAAARISKAINSPKLPSKIPLANTIRYFGLGALKITPLLLLFSAITYCTNKVSGFEYIASNFGIDYFSSHYVVPEKVALSSNKPKNLVLIYVESLEASYADKKIFGKDLLSDIEDLGGVSFEHYNPAPGTGWTIAAIIATQCGIPLKVVLAAHDGNSQGDEIKSFLPNATCLGDILASRGYQNVFLGGASLGFAGKGTFLHDHGYQNVFGREEWLKQGAEPADMNGWGLYDDDLFSNAKTKLQELHRNGQPFNLTLLTVDTHHPSGNFSKSCLKGGAKEFVDIVKCSSVQVSNFVRFMKDNDYLKDTNIVILGDHLAMVNPVWEQLNSSPQRSIFNSFISNSPLKKNRDDIVPFDLFPSILEFIGIEVAGDRLGLGFSGFHESQSQPEPDRIAQMERSLLNNSSAYLNLWDQRQVMKKKDLVPSRQVTQTGRFYPNNRLSSLN